MPTFSDKLLTWFQQHGRKNLPWQQQPTAYRVWISEIMLQQTQVQTVIPYFERFMQRFPDLPSLASAPQDDVLHHWSGLGYYARARNLHKAAQQIVETHAGKFPSDLESLQQLPGIGRSTAGAIMSLAFQQRQPILDGNVKRVLTRFHAIEGWPGQSQVEKQLWDLADQHTPQQDVAAYTQAIMDLGATLCTRSKPDCINCPMQQDCKAKQTGRQSEFPFSKPKKKIPTRQVTFIIIRDQNNAVLLEKRPPTGIWGGLWGFPECELAADIDPNIDQDIAVKIKEICKQRFGIAVSQTKTLSEFRHTFSHFHLQITPILVQISQTNLIREPGVMEPEETLWYNMGNPKSVGLAAPVTSLLQQLNGETQ